MKKIILTLVISIFMCLFFAACSASEPEPSSDAAREDPVSEISNKGAEKIEVIDDTFITDQLLEDVPEEMPEKKKNAKAIVWLGDSLTQGSLGDDNDNLANAPYEKLKKMVNVPVEGYGMYGFNTHDVLWVYTDKDHYNQIADPDKTYIFWLGSNDWVTSEAINSNTEPVIKEIDRFLNLEDGGIQDYIVLGTTSRWRLGDLYIPINNDLAEHYGEHYMDVIDIINKYGYSSDNTHLSQESYDAIAAAVYEKLKTLGYI